MTITLAGHGPNIGHGWVKYVIIDGNGKELEPIVFPATIARASQAAAGSLTRVATVKLGQHRYWTGWDAQLSANQLTMLGQDRLADPVFIPALLSGALERFGHLNGSSRGVCVSGLPASWTEQTGAVDGKEVKNVHETRLGAALRAGSGTEMYHKVVVIAEPLGLAYSVLLDNHGQMAGDPKLATGRLGLVDLGHRTDDTAEVLRLSVIKSSLTSEDLGTVGPLTEIRSRISAHFDCKLTILETDMAMRTGTIAIAGRLRDLPHGWDRPLIENGNAKAARLREAWGSGHQFERIIIGGGGAELEQLTAPTLAKFENAVVAELPQTAIPRGYARLARRIAGTLR
jgi:hypothetical protein